MVWGSSGKSIDAFVDDTHYISKNFEPDNIPFPIFIFLLLFLFSHAIVISITFY